jgi:MoaA/NifB/PqqE/SkfB family radical SAM enzyme
MKLGFAVTQHCNLRCPHCIRDDVTLVRDLPLAVIRSVTDQALELFGRVGVSLTGGEPLLHQGLADMVAHFASRGVRYRIVTNGWHIPRALPILERHPPETIRLSLSAATEPDHDAVRGRGSFIRVLRAAALLTSRRIPPSLSMVVDRTSRRQLEQAAELADTLGARELQYILPQPVPGSVGGDTDLPLSAWSAVRDEVRALVLRPRRRARLELAYGFPFDGPEALCGTKSLDRLYVDSQGRLCTCCQLSDYGSNENEVVADLTRVSLAEAWPQYTARMQALTTATERTGDASDPFDPFPCLRCARGCGKLDWQASLVRIDRSPVAAAGSR